ncbi:MAG: hypothetical protein KJ697_03705 [Nanoarchaeota archaeon]|nr:hypothetical protein [Nanoarchaeota archaeon]MBU4124489.1 hypothetical protein [Nanoarchaeota archaeon]
MSNDIPTEEEVAKALIKYEDIKTDTTKGVTDEKAWGGGGHLDYHDGQVTFKIDVIPIGEFDVPVLSACIINYCTNKFADMPLFEIVKKLSQIEHELISAEEISAKHELRLDCEYWRNGDKLSEKRMNEKYHASDIFETIQKLSINDNYDVVLRSYKAIFKLNDVDKMYNAQKEFADRFPKIILDEKE